MIKIWTKSLCLSVEVFQSQNIYLGHMRIRRGLLFLKSSKYPGWIRRTLQETPNQGHIGRTDVVWGRLFQQVGIHGFTDLGIQITQYMGRIRLQVKFKL